MRIEVVEIAKELVKTMHGRQVLVAVAQTRHNLAVVYDDMGKLEQAEEQWRMILKEMPAYLTAWKCLGETLLKANKLEQVEQLAMAMRGQVETHIDGFILTAKHLERQGQAQEAIELLENKLKQKPQDLDLLRELCRLHFEHSSPETSLDVLQRLAKQDPHDASAFHNLGTAYLQLNRYEDAVNNYKRSLELRPQSPETWNLLGHAHNGAGDTISAKKAWKQTLLIYPEHKEAALLYKQL